LSDLEKEGAPNAWGKKIALAVVASLGVLTVLEIGLRLVPPKALHDPLADRSTLFYEIQPARRHPWTAGASNVLRIAVVGDSFTRGCGVQIDDRYGAHLERMLNLNTGLPPAEVLVYDEPGTSTFQQLPLVRRALAEKPRVLVLGICLNDTEDWANPRELHRWREDQTPHPPAPWLAPALRVSRTLAFLYNRAEGARAYRGYLRYYRRLFDPDYKGMMRFREALRIVRDECRTNGVVFVPMVFPLLSDEFAEGRYPFGYAHESIHRIWKDLDLTGLDLLPQFQGTSPERVQVIPGLDPHPDEIAHRMAAEALLEFLLRQGLVDGGYRPVERPSEAPLRANWERVRTLMWNPAAAPPPTGGPPPAAAAARDGAP
jgi:hypothetical protein